MSEAPAPPKRRRWRLIVLVIGAIALPLGGWMAYELHTARQVWPDEMPALEMPPPVIPLHPEALATFDAMLLAATPLDPDHDARLALLDAEEPPSAPLDGWPPDNPPAHAALDAFLATGGLKLPPMAIDAPPDREFMPLLRISALRRVRALKRMVEGDPGGAWLDVADVWTLGERLSYSGAHLLGTMIGMALERQALDTALRLLAAGPWHADAGALARGLDAAAERPSPLVAALVGECLAMDALYIRMGQADVEHLSEEGVPMGGVLKPAPPGATRADETWLFDSEKTRAFSRRHCLSSIEAAGTPAPQRRPTPEIDLGTGDGLSWGAMIDNPVGRTLLSVVQIGYRRYMDRADQLAYRRRSVRIALARSAYAAGVGRAAREASDLVPTYLARMPTDPLTGAEMPLDPPPLSDDD